MKRLLFAISLVLAGCGVGAEPGLEPIGVAPVMVDQPWLNVAPGMTAAEVERAAGAPCEVRAQTWDPSEIWIYRSASCSSATAWCVFLKSGVVERVAPYCQNG